MDAAAPAVAAAAEAQQQQAAEEQQQRAGEEGRQRRAAGGEAGAAERRQGGGEGEGGAAADRLAPMRFPLANTGMTGSHDFLISDCIRLDFTSALKQLCVTPGGLYTLQGCNQIAVQ